MSFAHNKVSLPVGATQVNHQWSVGHSAYCMGVCVVYTNDTLSNQASGTAVNMSLGATYNQKFDSDVLRRLSLDYFWPPAVKNTALQIGNHSYPMQNTPPIANAQNSSYITAVDQCLQMFGSQYSTSIERFLTIDHVQFIPVHKRLANGELFQFYQTIDNGVHVK